MPNKIVGNVLAKCTIYRFSIRHASNSIIIYLSWTLNIHYLCEFRTPAQISINYDCTIKARTILNGKDQRRKHDIHSTRIHTFKRKLLFKCLWRIYQNSRTMCFCLNTIIRGSGGVSIGKNVISGANCYIISSNHNFDSEELPIMLQGDTKRGITIGNNLRLGTLLCWMGYPGNNCVIGAGTIVRKNIPCRYNWFTIKDSALSY